jgi:hypothetical protein
LELEPERIEENWRKPITDYLRDSSQKVDKGIRRIDFKFTLINDELYCHTAEDLLLKCLDHDQAKIVVVKYMKAFVTRINQCRR